MKLWIIQYSHRHGTDVWPHFASRAPTEREIISQLSDWEPDREEWIEINGPYDLPECKKCAKRAEEAAIKTIPAKNKRNPDEITL